MKIIAHRGSSAVAPENTISSFQLAWIENADGIELDIYMTSDQVIVSIHDSTTTRTSDFSLEINKSTSEELQKADVGGWKSNLFKNERIPSLISILEIMPIDKDIYIEIKDSKEIIPLLKKTIMRFPNLKSSIILIAFSYDIIKQIKSCLPDHKCLWIVEFSHNVPAITDKECQNVINKIIEAKLDGISSFADVAHCKQLAPYIKSNNLFWNVWTVDSISIASEMKKLGINSLSTNRPRYIISNLE